MAAKSKFPGFPKGTIKFLKNLRNNNDKRWFEDHRSDYENLVLNPARDFISEMGDRLRKFAPGVHAEPKVDRSIFRIWRDTRFSRDKSPFKSNLGIWFWVGNRKRIECPGFYLHIDPDTFFMGAGMKEFPPDLLAKYRAAVDDDKRGGELVRLIKKVEKAGPYSVGRVHYKRVPRGFDPDHPRAELLKHNTLFAGLEGTAPKELFTSACIDFCATHFKKVSPIERWMTSVFG